MCLACLNSSVVWQGHKTVRLRARERAACPVASGCRVFPAGQGATLGRTYHGWVFGGPVRFKAVEEALAILGLADLILDLITDLIIPFKNLISHFMILMRPIESGT